MPRRSKQVPSVLMRVWTNYTKTRNWLLAAGSAILMLTALWALAAPYAEAMIPVTHRYARVTIIPRIIVAQLDANKERRERLLRENKDREIELQSPGATATPQYRALVQERLDMNKKDIEELDRKDKTLFDEQKDLKK